MSFRSVAFGLALLAAAGCKPAARGRCSTAADCRQGSYCSIPSAICLASSGTCSPACGSGEICSGSACAVLLPTVSVTAPTGPISPAFPQITVHVDAAQAITLHGIDLEVDTTKAVATGSLAAPHAGDNLITLTHFEPNVQGQASVHATLRYQVGSEAEQSVSSLQVPVTIDTQPPTVTVFVPPASDAVGGWVPRTSGTLEVRATVDDGIAGSGAQSATLSFDLCPAAAACEYVGAVLSQAGGATVYSFTVPRSVQAAGAELPLAVTVKAQDVAGNQAQGTGVVQIDDAPPQIGPINLVSTTGVIGEDGNMWFAGGVGAANVEIVVSVTDNGVGVASVALHLHSPDLPGFTGSLDPAGLQAADGWHFQLPASGVRGREGRLRFTLTAQDKLQHVATVGPNDPNTLIWVDDKLPSISAPHVNYAGASPPTACGAPDSSSFKCGRQLATSPHLLADDTATVTFDAIDCGVGMGSASALPATVSTNAGGPRSVPSAEKNKSNPQCANGNKTHHYQFTLDLSALAAVLDPPVDTAGTTLLQLTANARDVLLHAAQSAPNPGTSGDGLALISLWRWKNQVAQTITQPSGSPTLIPGTAGARQIAVGTTLPGSGSNLFVLNADGSPAWSATVASQMAGDLAVGPSGRLYTVSPPASCMSPCAATFNIILAPASGSIGTVHACTPTSNVSFGSPPAIIVTSSASERAVVASNAHAAAATSNVFLFEENSGCQADTPALVGVGADYFGITANWPTIFLSTGQGFSSADNNGSTFGAPVAYNGTVPTLSPPAIATSSLRAFFGSTDHTVRSAKQSLCTVVSCWVDDPAFPTAAATNPVPFTPVFDAADAYAADDHAVVYAFPRSSGGPTWTEDFRNPTPPLPPPWPSAASATLAPPVLLLGGIVLVVRSDGVVAEASSPGIVPLLKVGVFGSGQPVAPVLDARGTGAVAYVPDGEGWVWALQLPTSPLAAGPNTWPRPGRDSCNSRNAASSCP